MDEDLQKQALPDPPKDATSASFIFFWLSIAVMVYALGIGPAALLHLKCNNSAVRNTIEVFYKPLELIAKSKSPLRAPLLRYVELWIGRQPYK
jgi:hypothetical protein